MMMLIPEAWAENPLMEPTRRAFYEYHAALMEPWDGPAAMAFTDGRQIGATLDRNGLRPARYFVTDDDHVDHGVGSRRARHSAEERIVRKWRLQPGKMLLVDLEQGRIIDDDEIKARDRDRAALSAMARRERRSSSKSCRRRRSAPMRRSRDALLHRQQAFGYTQEDMQLLPGADGAGRRGADRLDGHRHAAGGAVRQRRSCSTTISSSFSRR